MPRATPNSSGHYHYHDLDLIVKRDRDHYQHYQWSLINDRDHGHDHDQWSWSGSWSRPWLWSWSSSMIVIAIHDSGYFIYYTIYSDGDVFTQRYVSLRQRSVSRNRDMSISDIDAPPRVSQIHNFGYESGPCGSPRAHIKPERSYAHQEASQIHLEPISTCVRPKNIKQITNNKDKQIILFNPWPLTPWLGSRWDNFCLVHGAIHVRCVCCFTIIRHTIMSEGVGNHC